MELQITELPLDAVFLCNHLTSSFCYFLQRTTFQFPIWYFSNGLYFFFCIANFVVFVEIILSSEEINIFERLHLVFVVKLPFVFCQRLIVYYPETNLLPIT